MSRLRAPVSRNLVILNSIVQTYIETGEPVASAIIAKRLGSRLSAASVRNVMAELYEQGYLAQPHTSAGRVPTSKAFSAYVQSLTTTRILAAELHRLRNELARIETFQGRVEHTSHLLTEMTLGLGIAAAIPTEGQTLDQIELLSLGDRKVLMVVVTKDHMVRNRVVQLQEHVSQDELHWIRNYLNQNFSGWMLSDVKTELQRRLEQESAAFDEVLKKLQLLYEKGLLDIGLAPEIHMEGAANLVGLDLHLTREKMRELFQELEQKKRVLMLLDRFLEHPLGEISVRVGLSDAHPSMGEFSLIGISVPLPNGLSGKFAVLGPMRMNYERVMSAVLHVGQAFQSSQA